MRLWLAVALATVLLPSVAAADAASPFSDRVPHHFVFEVAGEHPGYQFWLVSRRGVEPLDVAPGRPCRIDGTNRNGSHRIAHVVAVPADTALRAENLVKAVESDKLPAGVFRSDELDFGGAVPFYDSRQEVIDTYRLELVPGERVRLVRLSQNAGSRWVKASWAAAGVFAVLGIVWGGFRLLRRKPRVTEAEPGAAPNPTA